MKEFRNNFGLQFDCDLLADDLKAYQKKTGKSLSDLEKTTGINKSTLSRFRSKKENALFIEVLILAFEMDYNVNRYKRVEK